MCTVQKCTTTCIQVIKDVQKRNVGLCKGQFKFQKCTATRIQVIRLVTVKNFTANTSVQVSWCVQFKNVLQPVSRSLSMYSKEM